MIQKVLLLLAALVLTAGVVVFLTTGDQLLIRKVEVELAPSPQGEHYSELKDVLEESFQAYVGLPLWELSLSYLSAKLKELTWIESFTVSRSLLGTVNLELSTEEMVALWAREPGKVVPISRTGKVLQAAPLGKVPDLPILRATEMSEEDGHTLLLSGLLEELKAAPTLDASNLREIYFSTDKGFAVELFAPDVVVEFGWPPYSTKVQRVEKVVQYLERNDLQSRVIDATFQKKVLVRARKAPYAD